MNSLRRLGRKGLPRLLVIVVVVIAVFPVYWTVHTSLLTTSDLFSRSPRFLPDLANLDVYQRVFYETPILMWLGNSFFIAFGTTFACLMLAIFAAYSLSRYKFRGKGVFGFGLFITQMLPEALLVVPLYALFVVLGLLNNMYGLVLANTAFTMPILVWILKSAIDGVPIEVEEAARVDGCSTFGIQLSVVWPIILPSIAAASVIAFFNGWNEFLFALTFIIDDAQRPASVGLASFIGELSTPLEIVMSAATLYTLPAVVFFLFIQRHVVSGLAAGSVKG